MNAWRPAHIHFSVFGSAFTQRIITQMYFPGDPLFALDPIYNTIRSQKDRDRLIGAYNHDLTVPEFSMGYGWDIVVDGPDATWFEPEGDAHDAREDPDPTPGQTIGPFFAFGLDYPKKHEVVFRTARVRSCWAAP